MVWGFSLGVNTLSFVSLARFVTDYVTMRLNDLLTKDKWVLYLSVSVLRTALYQKSKRCFSFIRSAMFWGWGGVLKLVCLIQRLGRSSLTGICKNVKLWQIVSIKSTSCKAETQYACFDWSKCFIITLTSIPADTTKLTVAWRKVGRGQCLPRPCRDLLRRSEKGAGSGAARRSSARRRPSAVRTRRRRSALVFPGPDRQSASRVSIARHGRQAALSRSADTAFMSEQRLVVMFFFRWD